MSGILAAFAQKLNVGSPKSLQRRTGPSTCSSICEGSSYRSFQVPECTRQTYRDSVVCDVDCGSEILSLVQSAELIPWISQSGSSSLSVVSGSSQCTSPKDASESGILPPFCLPEEADTPAPRQGLKGLFILRSREESSPSTVPSQFKRSFTPLSSLSQRFTFSICRRNDSGPISEDGASPYSDRDGPFDPFACIAPSVFYNDEGTPSYEPCISSLKNDFMNSPQSRLHFWVPCLDPPSPTIDTTLPCNRQDNNHTLKPLILPERVARREIAEAQDESIVLPTSPKIRPLVLPQRLARSLSRRPQPCPRRFAAGAPTFKPTPTVTNEFKGQPITRSPLDQTSSSPRPEQAQSLRHVSQPCLRRGDRSGNVIPQHTACSPTTGWLQASSSPQHNLKEEPSSGTQGLGHYRQEILCETLEESDTRPVNSTLQRLVQLLHQEGFITGPTPLPVPLAVPPACSESGNIRYPQASCSPRLCMKESTSSDLRLSLLEAMDDDATTSWSMWSIATTHTQSVVGAFAL